MEGSDLCFQGGGVSSRQQLFLSSFLLLFFTYHSPHGMILWLSDTQINGRMQLRDVDLVPNCHARIILYIDVKTAKTGDEM